MSGNPHPDVLDCKINEQWQPREMSDKKVPTVRRGLEPWVLWTLRFGGKTSRSCVLPIEGLPFESGLSKKERANLKLIPI
jgi:hypothetical protein